MGVPIENWRDIGGDVDIVSASQLAQTRGWMRWKEMGCYRMGRTDECKSVEDPRSRKSW
jgi:hypothetical protein